MMRHTQISGFATGLLVATLLIAAQSVAAVHDFKHETGAPQNQFCATCVAASQLASACVDSTAATDVVEFGSVLNATSDSQFSGFDALDVRQRGPPPSV